MCTIEDKIIKYRTNPIGIKDEVELQKICLKCGSRNVKQKSEQEYYFIICQDCNNIWYVNHCWNCGKLVDDRDPQNPKCSKCDWLKCTCGACYINGCLTNPYNRDNKLKNLPQADQEILEYNFNEGNENTDRDEMCDWCGIRPVEYRDAAYSLCENCSNQLHGY